MRAAPGVAWCGWLLVAAAASLNAARATELLSPIGTWKTYDDKTGVAKAMVQIYDQKGRLYGRIVQSFRPGAETRTCEPCKDDRHGKPVIGLVIIRDMRPDGDEYAGGDILDPESGSVYHCKLHVDPDGTHLVVRGYIGFSLLGRTQTWERQH